VVLTEGTIEEAAQVIADQLRHHAKNSPLTCPETWVGVCGQLNCKYVPYAQQGAGRGEFASYPCPEFHTGVIAINTAYPTIEICHAWVHELAHAKLHLWVPPQLTDAADAHRYEGDPADIRHRIARRVEELIFGGEAL
jgi:hypothetical protein